MSLDLERISQTLAQNATVRIQGRLRGVVGLALHVDLPEARVGELVEITRRDGPPLLGEVVGFDADGVTVMPLGAAGGLGPSDIVTPPAGWLASSAGCARAAAGSRCASLRCAR